MFKDNVVEDLILCN